MSLANLIPAFSIWSLKSPWCIIYPNAHKKGAWGTVKLEGTIPDTAGSNGIMGTEVLKRIAILPNLCDNTLRSFGSIC